MLRSVRRLRGTPMRAASVNREKRTARSESSLTFSTSNKPSRTANGFPLPGTDLAERVALRSRCRRRLQLIRKRVVVARVAVMQKAANGAEEVDSAGGQLFFRGAAAQRLLLFAANLAQPGGSLVIAQSAGGVLHVRLKVKNRVAVTCQAFLGQLVQLREQEWPRGLFRSGQHSCIQPLEKLRVSREKAAIEQRQMKLCIVFFNALAFFERAARGADAKAEIPERAREIGNQRTELLLRLVVAEKKK